jgi:hypothetical protein
VNKKVYGELPNIANADRRLYAKGTSTPCYYPIQTILLIPGMQGLSSNTF